MSEIEVASKSRTKKLKLYLANADKNSMTSPNSLIMNLLRIITPDEIHEIATKHNGGKFLLLTDLVTERLERKIYRDFSGADSVDEIHQEHQEQREEREEQHGAKILPFVSEKETSELPLESQEKIMIQKIPDAKTKEIEENIELAPHKEAENMSSFIMIEKARLKKSQKSLKKKEIIDLYQKNSNVHVEMIKNANRSVEGSGEAGVLVNKKQY